MAAILQVQVIGAKETIRHLNGIMERLPLAVDDAIQEFGESAVKNLKREVQLKGLVWRGKLLGGIYWARLSRVRGELRMPLEGIYVDRMRPHWVKLKRGRLIRQWAIEHGIFQTEGKPFTGSELFAAAKEERSIFVRPHPFIDKPLRRSINDLPRILKRHVSRAVQK